MRPHIRIPLLRELNFLAGHARVWRKSVLEFPPREQSSLCRNLDPRCDEQFPGSKLPPLRPQLRCPSCTGEIPPKRPAPRRRDQAPLQQLESLPSHEPIITPLRIVDRRIMPRASACFGLQSSFPNLMLTHPFSLASRLRSSQNYHSTPISSVPRLTLRLSSPSWYSSACCLDFQRKARTHRPRLAAHVHFLARLA
jgi:hypothetical protein